MRSLAIVLALSLFACSGDKPKDVDANPAGPMCAGSNYDLCTTEHDCTNGNCKLFMSDGFQVCTTTCTAGDNSTCPTQDGQPATCNAMGICKPAAPNHCHL